MKTAHEVFAGFGNPGLKVNSKSFSKMHSNTNFQVGGNRMTGAMRPQLTVPSDRKQFPTFTQRPTQNRTIAPGAISGRAGQKVPFNNSNKRPLAGSVHAGVGVHAQRGANTLTDQQHSRATSRGLSQLNTTSRRGGSSVAHFAKPVAGTNDTYALPGISGGRNAAQFTKVTSVHHIGLHKVVVTKHVPRSINRLTGQSSTVIPTSYSHLGG